MSVEAILIDLEFVKALVVDMDNAVETRDSEKAASLLNEARDKIDSMIKTLQFNRGI
ncbi:MAG: hypothetical protein IID33_10665 [Planctomycetes bacterium]|nr:hypothetical protein [Planctomycetota bacterium]